MGCLDCFLYPSSVFMRYVSILSLHHLSPLFFDCHFLLEDLILVEALTLSNLVLQLFLSLVIFEQEGVVLLGNTSSHTNTIRDYMYTVSFEVLNVLLQETSLVVLSRIFVAH